MIIIQDLCLTVKTLLCESLEPIRTWTFTRQFESLLDLLCKKNWGKFTLKAQLAKMYKESSLDRLVSYFFNLFYWSIVDLQCCVNFCCTAKWFSYTYIDILFHILFHYGLSQDIEYSSLCYTGLFHIFKRLKWYRK